MEKANKISFVCEVDKIMINFAEELVYWYLRLNGFFLLQNFVLHHLGKGPQRGTGDSDLLAIRFPYVYEEIGGQKQDWDRERFLSWGEEIDMEIDKDKLAFIVEVKSGGNVSRGNIQGAFHEQRLKYAIYRFGIFPENEVCDIAKKLSQGENKHTRKGAWVIAKLAVTERRVNGPWLNLLLVEADKFIINRIKAYPHDKYTDRFYFPNALIQYLAWKRYDYCNLNQMRL